MLLAGMINQEVGVGITTAGYPKYIAAWSHQGRE
jgi:hypothetical protein